MTRDDVDAQSTEPQNPRNERATNIQEQDRSYIFDESPVASMRRFTTYLCYIYYYTQASSHCTVVTVDYMCANCAK